MSRIRIRLAVLILSVACARSAAAQSILEKVIESDEQGAPIVMTSLDSLLISRIARSAAVPVGMEFAARPGPQPSSGGGKQLTGLTVRAALDVITMFDPRYEWREMNGTIVLRPRDAWDRPNHPLNLPIQPLVLREIRARNALSIVAAFLGSPQYTDPQIGDVKRFSVTLDHGTVLDLLNAVVSAHGALAWSFETSRTKDRMFPFMVSIQDGAGGEGCGVPGRSPEAPVNVARYLDPPPVSARESVLDRTVGIGPNALPLVVYGPYPYGVQTLAKATRVPMGIEFLGPGQQPPTLEITATGRTLREVLDEMIAVDPRYEWREMDGVIVIRPTASWSDPDHPLFRIVGPIRMIDVPPQEAVQRLARELGYPHPLSLPGGKSLTLDLPQGSVLDLANAIVRAHGELTWTLEPEPPLDGARVGYKYTFTFSVMGGSGHGFGAR